MIKRFTFLIILGLMSLPLSAAEYLIDKKGMHAFIQFKVSHLGYSWLYGRFNDFDGSFTYDSENPAAAQITVNINTASVDSNHAERDKHLRSDEFLHVDKFPKSRFVSTSIVLYDDGTGVLTGDFTLRGVTKPLTIDIKFIGEGDDPWGGYRAGFEGSTKLALADYGIVRDLGPTAKEVELFFSIEGIRQ